MAGPLTGGYPALRAVIFLTRLGAWRRARAIAALLGYPRVGVNVGGGVHARALDRLTVRHAYVVKHPTLSRWAVLADALVDALEGQSIDVDGTQETVSTATALTLDAAWDGRTEENPT